MNAELLAAATITGLSVGESADYLVSRYITRKAPMPSNLLWESLEEDDMLPLPVTDEAVEASRLDKIREKVNPYISYIAMSGAAAGFSLGMFASPAPRVHTEVRPEIGVVVAADSSMGALVKGEPVSIVADKYMQAIEQNTGFNPNWTIAYQGLGLQVSYTRALAALASPIGASGLDLGIQNAVPGNEAVIVLAGNSVVNNASADGGDAAANGTRIFVLNAYPSQGSDEAITEQKEITKNTGGEYYTSDQVSPAKFVKEVSNIIAPSKKEITTEVNTDKPEWGVAAGLSLLTGVVGALKRRKTPVQRIFKPQKRR